MEKFRTMLATVCCAAVIQAGAQTWVLQDQISFPEPQSIHFLNHTHGWIGGKNQIAATTDGGDTWNVYSLPDEEARIRGMHAIDENTLVVAGRHDDLEAFIGKTTDGGNNWVLQTDFPERLEDVAFASIDVGVCVGRKGLVLRTTDGGINWTAMPGFGSTDFKHINFYGNTGIMTGEGGAIRRSIDGGLTWTPVPSGTLMDLGQVQFVHENLVYIAGDGGILLRSTNSGISFSQVPVSTQNNLRGVYFADENTGWVVGFVGTILMTTQGGANWVDQSTAEPHQFQRIAGGSIESVFCGNENGEVYRYQMNTGTGSSHSGSLLMSPNPAHDKVYISSELLVSGFQVYDVYGKLVHSSQDEFTQTEIDVSSLPVGIYFVKLQEGSRMSTSNKFVVIR